MKKKLILVLLLSVISTNVLASMGNFTQNEEGTVTIRTLGTDDDAAT